MTNLVNKQHLIAALERTIEGLELCRPVAELCATMGQPQSLGLNDGALGVSRALLAGLLNGNFDAEDESALAECAVVRYSEDEGEDTEDMDDLAPEEESVVLGIVILPPCPSPEERAELQKWYEDKGYITKKNG